MHRKTEGAVGCGIVDEFIVLRKISVRKLSEHIGIAFTGEEKRSLQLSETGGLVVEYSQLVSKAELPDADADILDVEQQPAQMGQRRDPGIACLLYTSPSPRDCS